MRWLLIQILRLYRYAVSPLLGVNCRFAPSCSEYAEAVVEKYGAFTGCCLAIKRLSRCHPWHPGGSDPVP
jgi:uncharacterized protein